MVTNEFFCIFAISIVWEYLSGHMVSAGVDFLILLIVIISIQIETFFSFLVSIFE